MRRLSRIVCRDPAGEISPWPSSGLVQPDRTTAPQLRNKRRPILLPTAGERDMSDRGMAHLVGLGLTGVYFLCIALAAAAMM